MTIDLSPERIEKRQMELLSGGGSMCVSGKFGVAIATDYPSVEQLAEFAQEGWQCICICPGLEGSQNVPAGKVVIYFMHVPCHTIN